MEYLEVGKISEVNKGTMKAYIIKDNDILVANYNDNYYAIGRKCTHMGGDLSKGKLEGKIVICPRHGSRFDITTGESISGPKIGFLKLKTKKEPSYEVKIEDGKIFYQGKRIHLVTEMYNGLVPPDILRIFAAGNVLLLNGPIANILSNKLNLALLFLKVVLIAKAFSLFQNVVFST